MTMTSLPSVETPLDPVPAARPRLLSLRGRIGRAHYLACTMGAIVLSFLFMYALGLMLIVGGGLGRMLYIVISVLLFYCVLPVVFTILTIKRAHDFNRGGWLALLLLVPVLNLLFWFVPGTADENDYGAAPPQPSAGIKLCAAVLPLLLLTAFLATGGPHIVRQPDLASPSSSSSPAASGTSLQPYTP